MMRLFRGLDVKFVLALAALLISGTICWGFVQRGQHITEAEQSVSQLSGQVSSLIRENRRLHRQLAESERVATQRARNAAREREALRVELLRLINFLRENGFDVPTRGSGAGATYEPPRQSSPPPTTYVSAPHHHGQSGGSSSGGPGNSGSHSNGHPHHHHGHQSGLLPSLPPLPGAPLPRPSDSPPLA